MQKIKQNQKVDFEILLSFLITCGIVYFTMIKQASLISALISMSFIYVFVEYAKKCLYKGIGKVFIYLIAISVFFVFLNVTISGIGGGGYYKKAIMYIATLVWMTCCIHSKINTKTVIWIILLNFLINIIYIIFYRQGFTVFEGQTLLSMNFLNPNQAGMFIQNSLLYMCVFMTAGQDLGMNKYYYIISLIILIPLFLFVSYLMYLTGCRSSIMSLLAFLVLVCADYFIKNGFRLKRWMLFIIAIFPFLFAIIYINYITLFDFDVSMGMEDAGKSSTTRVSVWAPVIDNISYYLVYGDYYGISNGTGISQLHNTHVDVLASYGLIPFILFIIILYKTLRKSMSNANCRFQRISLFAFISCMISCTFEASLVAGSGGLFLLTLGFLLLANFKKDNYENSTSKLCIS